jgi:D-alanyl-D-alanine carboxypeptidase/D-alanyl-D-alanine-endopeptidase (penicillin-binding protein 4)
MKKLFLFFVPLFLWAEHLSVSAYAINAKTGHVIVDWDGERSLVPASCMKVVTTGAALGLMGSESRFMTDLIIEGGVVDGVLHGNVIIQGGGDPCLGSDRLGPDQWEKQITVWKEALIEAGIKEIQGRVIGDASKWEKAMAPSSWLWEDLGNYYGAGASALSFHENMAFIQFRPGQKIGSPAHLVGVTPAALNYVIQNEVMTGPAKSGDQVIIYGTEYAAVQFARGTMPIDAENFSVKGSIPDPAKMCSELLVKRKKIHQTQSPTLLEIVYWTNQKSINLYAEHLIKHLGQGSTSSGVKAVTEFWKRQGIDMEGFNMVDGSGLSRKNFMTAKQLVSILAKMQASPYFSQFLTSLPENEPGIFAKTGTMSFVRCLTGYKGDYIFAILINNGMSSQAMQDKIDQFKKLLP